MMAAGTSILLVHIQIPGCTASHLILLYTHATIHQNFNSVYFNIFTSRHVRVVAKSAYYLCRVRTCQSPCTSAASTGEVSVKFDIGNFHENLSRNSRFG